MQTFQTIEQEKTFWYINILAFFFSYWTVSGVIANPDSDLWLELGISSSIALGVFQIAILEVSCLLGLLVTKWRGKKGLLESKRISQNEFVRVLRLSVLFQLIGLTTLVGVFFLTSFLVSILSYS